MCEWFVLMESKSGECGVFNWQVLVKQVVKNGRCDVDWDFGINFCFEIILCLYQFCNLIEVVCCVDDMFVDLKCKVELVIIFGII